MRMKLGHRDRGSLLEEGQVGPVLYSPAVQASSLAGPMEGPSVGPVPSVAAGCSLPSSVVGS